MTITVQPKSLRMVLLVAAAVVVGWLLAGNASASHGPGSVHVCAANSGGAMRKVGGSSACSSSETHLALATAGSVNSLKTRVAALESANTALKARVKTLETKFQGVSRQQIGGRDTLRFTGMNVQVVNGKGKTDAEPNGEGNVIIGYNEQRPNTPATRIGSHYLVVGDMHEWTRYSGTVVGHLNTASGDFASVSGGGLNKASGSYSSVSGGSANTASSSYSSVSGGTFATASGYSSSVLGGWDETASGDFACNPACP